MAQTNVSSCVLSIVASFANGLDVFRKFRETSSKKKRWGKKDVSAVGEEMRLARSLRQGPEDIGREYQKSILIVGDEFAMGDVIAQTSLAEILLKLNTGLVTIISTFLSRDKRDPDLDYQSLISLSDRSRVDTCRTLRQLYHRILQHRLPRQIDPLGREGVENRRSSSKGQNNRKVKQHPSSKQKVRGPMLARVVIADSSKPSRVAMVRPGERKKRSNSSSSTLLSKSRSSPSLVPSAPAPFDGKSLEASARLQNQRSEIMHERPNPRLIQSTTDLNSRRIPSNQVAMQASRSTPRLSTSLPENDPLPPIPTSALLSAMEPRRRKPTPTYFSIESASTKLGQIPMHKWAEPYDFELAERLNQEALQNGWPMTAMNNPQRKKRRGLFGLFRRK